MKCECGMEFGKKYLPKDKPDFKKDSTYIGGDALADKEREWERENAVGITMLKHPRGARDKDGKTMYVCQFCYMKIVEEK